MQGCYRRLRGLCYTEVYTPYHGLTPQPKARDHDRD